MRLKNDQIDKIQAFDIVKKDVAFVLVNIEYDLETKEANIIDEITLSNYIHMARFNIDMVISSKLKDLK